MSTLAIDLGNGMMPAETALRPVKNRIESGREWRKQFEPGWASSAAMAAGKHWLEMDRRTRQLVLPPELQGKELYSPDVINEYRTTALGELGSDDDRPELLLRREDAPSQGFQRELNRGVEWGWTEEWHADEALDEVDEIVVDYGTGGIRCRFDPNQGKQLGSVPHRDGKPVLDMGEATDLLGNGPRPDVQMRPIRQGRICWEVLAPTNIIVPPGVPRERNFPWECVVRPALISSVQDEYGDLADDLKEDQDIGSLYGWTLDKNQGAGSASSGRLRDHVWLFTYFERPTRNWPRGRTIVFAGNQMVPLWFNDSLPYQAPDESWRSGISYFHWWRVSGRFWSRGLVELMKDPQRLIARRRTQSNDLIDRSMPFLVVEKDSPVLNRKGVPNEFVELAKGAANPVPVIPQVPSWLQADVEAIREDIDHATGIKQTALGENPASITTYSQLALIHEADQKKRERIRAARARSVARLIEDTVYDMRTYWGRRNVTLAGDEDVAEAQDFNATQIPAFVIVKIPTGAAKPRSQAADIQLVEDIARYSIESGQPLPVTWFAASLKAGQPLDLPPSPTDAHVQKALMENHRMLEGDPVEVDYFDPPGTHIPIHRDAQIEARLAGMQPIVEIIEQHIQQHQQIAEQQAAELQARAGGGAAAAPSPAGAPPPAPQSATSLPQPGGYPPQGAALNRLP